MPSKRGHAASRKILPMNIAGAGKRLMQHYLRAKSDDRHMDFSFTVLGVAERIQHIANSIIHIADLSPLMLPLTSRKTRRVEASLSVP